MEAHVSCFWPLQLARPFISLLIDLPDRPTNDAMISILTQERLLGFALGTAFAGFVVLEQRRRIYDSILPHDPDAHSQLREPIFGKRFRSQFGLWWNEAVDDTFGPVVAYLSSPRQ